MNISNCQTNKIKARAELGKRLVHFKNVSFVVCIKHQDGDAL